MNSKVIIKPISFLSLIMSASSGVYAAELILHQSPLYLSTSEKANVLVVIDNSNSMDEAANGSAVGSANSLSKSEIARSAVKTLVTNYTGKINMGLMAYQQSDVELYNLDNAPYDISFNPANYNSSFTGSREDDTKRYRVEKTDDLGNYIYYNVTLPYYYTGSSILSTYCYSETVVGLTGSPVDYHCYDHKTGTSDTQAVAAGYSSFQFDATFFPTDSDIAQGISSFGTLLASFYVSPTWFSNTSPGRGFLHIPIAELDASQVNKLNIKLSTSQFVTNAPTDPSQALQNAGLTPLEGTLLSAKDYFTGTSLPADEGGPAAALSESCDKDFITLLTDGLPSIDASGTETTDPAIALSAVATAAGALATEGVETYVIGFALPVGVASDALDTIASAGNTSTAFLANDLANLSHSLDTIFTDILDKTGASSAATNSTSLSTNSYIYQARFSSIDWSGQLLSKAISLDGVISSITTWDAATELDEKAANSRVILTYGRDTKDGIPFRWSNINGLTDTTAKDALNINALTATADGLGADRVDYLRGGTGGSSSGLFRADRIGKLGDIINSTPIYVGIPGAGYNDIEMSDYASFFSSYSARTPVLYAGANDGMLHGFNTVTGDEVLGYIPREVFSNLNKLTTVGYGTNVLSHQYYVDGAPMIADANVSGWKTILAGGLNAGGQGIYALDITDPSTFSESSADDIVLWEFTDEDDVDLGYTFVKPTTNFLTNQSAQIAKMANGKWAVIIGNGYNNTEADGNASTTGHAYLYVLFINEGTDGVWTLGTDYIKIDTNQGTTATPNGLATPTPIDTDGDGDIDSVYAGDLLGNMWKFDVSDPTPSNWGIAMSGNNPLFTAKDSSNNLQAITTAPLVTGHPHGGYMVGFGTGKYIELNDVSNTAEQTFYGIRDNNTNVPNVFRSGLVEQTIIDIQNAGDYSYRLVSLNAVDYSSSKGWFIDLPESGERVDVNPVIRDGRFVFVTRTPTTVTCSTGGSSWLMEVDYLTGGRLNFSPFDVNDDNVINESDLLGYTDPDEGPEIDIAVTGRQDDDDGMLSAPAVLETDNPEIEYKVVTDSLGEIKSLQESAKTSYKGRISWEEIR